MTQTLQKLTIVVLTISFLGMVSCSNRYQGYVEEGMDKVIKKYKNTPDYTMLLVDQTYENDQFKHKYDLLIPKTDSTFDTESTDWMVVSPEFFKKYEESLGMEVAHKENGILTKRTLPPGYSEYVGNEKYGQWRERDGGSFWEFYGKYALLSSIFRMGAYNTSYGMWNTYDRSYRYGTGNYYGPYGAYGTSAYTSSTAGRNSTWGQKPASFKQSVRNRVSRSTARRSRGSSRYSFSSTRSRSGGFGK